MRAASTAAWLLCASAGSAFAQAPALDAATWAAEIGSRYDVTLNVPYRDSADVRARLDLYVPRGATQPVPAVIYIHGGGWMGGDKARSVLHLLPYLERGWAVVNVEYTAGPGTAPAAVEDCRCALSWVARNAARHRIDDRKLVLTGESAGGHLALITAMLPEASPVDSCPGASPSNVAAVVNWYGIADVGAATEGAHAQAFAVSWLGNRPDPTTLARQVSPSAHVRAGLPPILSVHGDADRVAPYALTARLHEALDAAKVPNRLITVRGGAHGGFPRDEMVKAYAAIREFLMGHGIGR
jgi:acetyl esterase/lipase